MARSIGSNAGRQGADERRRGGEHRGGLGLPGVPDRAEVDGEELAQEGLLDELPVVDVRDLVVERERPEPAAVASVAVDEHDLREPRAQAADDLPGQLDQELGRERDGDSEADVVRALARPDGRRDDHVPLGKRGRAQADGLDEERVGADRQVLAVLLERADREDAHGPAAAALACLLPGRARLSLWAAPAIGLSTSTSRR